MLPFVVFHQVDARASSLNANDAFLLRMPGGRGYLWVGKGASEEEETGAEYISKKLECNSKRIMEGEEPGSSSNHLSVCMAFCRLAIPSFHSHFHSLP